MANGQFSKLLRGSPSATRPHRVLRFLAVSFFLLRAHAQEKLPSADSEIYTVRQFAISHSRPVSFSVRYPKDWVKTDLNRRVVGETFTSDDPVICVFSPKDSTNGLPMIMIQRRLGGSAKDAAQATSNSYRKHFPQCTQRIFSSIETKAGEQGYLVVFEAKADQSAQSINHFASGQLPLPGRAKAQTISELFFNGGPKGSIQISVMTSPEDSALSESLRKLILESLRF